MIATVGRQIVDGLSPGYRVLEVGCGTGNVLSALEEVCSQGTVVGMDLLGEGLQYAQQRTSCSLVQGDLNTPPFSSQFDLIGVFDLLEHLPDDSEILRTLRTMLVEGGRLFLTVPAFQSLWSYMDDAAHHYRRYELTDLKNKLLHAGYQIEYLTYYMTSILPIVWAVRRLASLVDRRPTDDVNRARDLTIGEYRIVPIVNDLLIWLLAQEARLIAAGYTMPFGTSLVAIARKNTV